MKTFYYEIEANEVWSLVVASVPDDALYTSPHKLAIDQYKSVMGHDSYNTLTDNSPTEIPKSQAFMMFVYAQSDTQMSIKELITKFDETSTGVLLVNL